MRSLLGGLILVGVLGMTSARADIRIDKPEPPPAEQPAHPARPTPPATPDAPALPATEPRNESRGCAGREMGPEWLFGLAVLAIGLGGMRWQRARRTAST